MGWLTALNPTTLRVLGADPDRRTCRGACGEVKHITEFYGFVRKLNLGGTTTRYSYICIQCVLKKRYDDRRAKGAKLRPEIRTVLK